MTAPEKILALLQHHAPHGVPATALCQPDVGGIDFRKCISRLRRRGHVIIADPIPGKQYASYRLIGLKALVESS